QITRRNPPHPYTCITLSSPPPSLLLLFFFLYCFRDHRVLHSFPTRRSSDLWPSRIGAHAPMQPWPYGMPSSINPFVLFLGPWLRSEEHTSELQSRGHLVCRLLLEKKKKKIQLQVCEE